MFASTYNIEKGKLISSIEFTIEFLTYTHQPSKNNFYFNYNSKFCTAPKHQLKLQG